MKTDTCTCGIPVAACNYPRCMHRGDRLAGLHNRVEELRKLAADFNPVMGMSENIIHIKVVKNRNK